jgi:hypothetical protein
MGSIAGPKSRKNAVRVWTSLPSPVLQLFSTPVSVTTPFSAINRSASGPWAGASASPLRASTPASRAAPRKGLLWYGLPCALFYQERPCCIVNWQRYWA